MTKKDGLSLKQRRNEEIRLRLLQVYDSMYRYFGSRGWWPGETAFEICIGAILTQSVSWKNVEKAIGNLKQKRLMDFWSMHAGPLEEIEKCIVPTMYYRMKAKKIKAFVNHVAENYQGDFSVMFSKDLPSLREELLGVYGIGPETADSILLYAAGKPVFVVDAYTRRIFSRLGFFKEDTSYAGMQEFFMSHLEPEVSFYNEYHALIVGVGNRFCGNKKPNCGQCPVFDFCQRASGSG